MLREKGGTGFPTLQFMDADGNTLTTQGDRSVKGFEATLVKVQHLLDLRQRVAGGDKAAAADLFLAELAMGAIGWEEANEKAKGFKDLSAAQKKELGQLLLDAEIKHLIADAGRDAEKIQKVGQRFVEMLAAGSIPSPAERGSFWSFLTSWASNNGDPATFEKALNGLKEVYADEPRAQSYLERLSKQLEEMKAGKVDG